MYIYIYIYRPQGAAVQQRGAQLRQLLRNTNDKNK